ncbi:hypothetical protein P12x_003734 [Tundrisphaera lichenicola]|uniref:hypothetical protein n=1 Tax=Tundrisphaera lichenicola TaxID=2029860 RepID=UPI003EBBAA57
MGNSASIRRRWWKHLPVRLSVRAMMALVLIVGGGLGWTMHRARLQREAVHAIMREHGYVRYNWEGLNFLAKPTPPGDSLGIRWVLGPHYFDTPICVSLFQKAADDRMMAHIGRLRGLRVLSLSVEGPTPPSAEGMAEIRRLSHLEQFNVGKGGDAKGFLPHLGALSKLRSLGWYSSAATEADLGIIANLDRLSNLTIDGAALTEGGLMRLTELQALERLSIEGPTPGVDWEARGRFIKAMPNLREFMLDGRTIISDR